MRRLIIDTDTASDDAVALMMAMAETEDDIEVLCITTVCGNVDRDSATRNALQTLEVCGRGVPVYPGAAAPLCRELVTAVGVHGSDGMGDVGLVHPTISAGERDAVDVITEYAARWGDELEIVMLGPATNIARAIERAPEAMSGVRHIWSMGTAGFGRGNTGPVAEFNVYVDAEAYAALLAFDVPKTIIGFDVCLGESALTVDDLRELECGTDVSRFAVKCVSALRTYNIKNRGGDFADLPDAIAMAAALYDGVITETTEAYAYCCTIEPPAYGQVIFFDESNTYSLNYTPPAPNCRVVKKIDNDAFKRLLKRSLIDGYSGGESRGE